MQFRGPMEKGWRTSRLSEKNGDDGSCLASGSQRSGMKWSGAWKFVGDLYAECWWTEITV